METLPNVHDDDYIQNTRILNEWHKKMQNQLILSSVWVGISFLFAMVSMVHNYRHAKGPHAAWLTLLLSVILACSFFKQAMLWLQQEKCRMYTLSLIKDLLIACRQRTMLRLIFFIMYPVTYMLLLITTYIFYNNFIPAAAISVPIASAPLCIVLISLCIYNSFKCRQHLRQLDLLLKQVHSPEN